jgi:hypothetical protein
MVSAASGASDQGVWGVYRCVLLWRFQWGHRPETSAGDIADLVKSSFGGLRGLWSVCLGCLWMHIFMAVLISPSATSSDIAGRKYRRFLTAAALLARTCVITLDCTHTDRYIWGEGGDKKLSSSYGGGSQWRHYCPLWCVESARLRLERRCQECRRGEGEILCILCTRGISNALLLIFKLFSMGGGGGSVI